MNGTAARRSTYASPTGWAPPRELHARSWTEEHAHSVFYARKWRAQGGFLRQATYALIDVTLVCLSGIAVYGFRFGFEQLGGIRSYAYWQSISSAYLHGYSGLLVLYCSLVVLACSSQGLYRTPREITAFVESKRVAKAIALSTVVMVLFIFTSGNKEVSRLVVTLTSTVNFVMLAGWRYAKRQFVLHRAEHGIGQSRVLIVGAGKMGKAFAGWLQENRHLGYDVCGFLDHKPNDDKRTLGRLKDFRAVALEHFVDEVFVTIPADGEMVKQLFLEARDLRLNLHVLPDLYDGLAWRAPLHNIGGFPVLELYAEPIPATGLAVKRAIDFFAAFAGLVFLFPLFILMGLWIKIDSEGPVIYGAPRLGKKGKQFTCYKLRTMVDSANQQKNELRHANQRNGPIFKIEADPRVTRCGRWLRKFSVDELPQLVNVLQGDMSLVGPRPHPVDDCERYSIEHLRRLDVKPGMTGLWQVTARKDPSFETNMALDLEYIENWSLGLDINILLRTIPAVVRGEGA